MSVELIYVPGAEPPPSPTELGGKGHHLARLVALTREPGASFTVPRFLVVRAAAFEEHVLAGRAWPEDAASLAARAQATRTMDLPAALRDAIERALEAIGIDTGLLAVRSSATVEDSAVASFAGQFDTVLGIRAGRADRGAVWQALRDVWASAFGPRAAAYAGARRAGMAVVIQEMLDPSAAGVAFSVDPITGDDRVALVSAVYGLGEGLVSGALDADSDRVRFDGDRGSVVERSTARKSEAVRLAPDGGTRLEPVAADLAEAPALDEAEAVAIAGAARAIARALGAPQDVEWALLGPRPGDRRLAILQARPITTAIASPSSPAKSGERRVWDNSNIIESYSGVTTPLTFTFARAVYEDVYRQFCRVMGVDRATLGAHETVFAHMLGLVRGRVYYNLLNWYRTLALLPGFRWNRGFMERMMGVRESLADPAPALGTGARLGDLFRLVRMVGRMAWLAGRLERDVPAFRARVEATLEPLAREDVAAWPPERALGLYARLEREVLAHWQAPLVNDFFAMIAFGALCRLTERWLPGEPPTLVNDLLCGEGGIVSTEPARRAMALARRAAESPALTAALAEANGRGLAERLARIPEGAAFAAELESFLERFGDRCMEELKLETVTLREDPRFLIATIRAYAAAGTIDPAAAWERERSVRREAERLVGARLSEPRAAIYRWVLGAARRRVRDRENLRFERTRVFGVARRIFLALGAHLAHAGRLDQHRDVFYLTREELFAHFDGAASSDLRGLAAERRREFEAYAREPDPPDRFETFGPPGDWGGPTRVETRAASTAAAPSQAPRASGGPPTLTGTGCCPGVVQAPVRVVRDPREAGEFVGRILVAERTDPGWTLLFPTARGLLVQRGSLLSHSAIVAREMGLPCVVGIAGLLATLRDGEAVEMDGARGIVRLVERGG